MIYFLFVPVWLLAVVGGLGMLLFKRLRRLGAVLIASTTLGLGLSLVASTVAMLGYGAVIERMGLESNGLVLIALYLLGAAGGGLLGALVGVLLALRLTRPKRVAQAA